MERLQAAGHRIDRVPTQRDDPATWFEPHLGEADALVVVGGDGAVRLAAGPAARRETPLYFVPSGTENLFAREFGTDHCLAKLVTAFERFETTDIDLATANGAIFVLMASIGYDAEVVHDLAARRGRSISHLTYLRPMIRQLLRWSPTALTIHVDGTQIVADEPGFVVVGNSRQYATHLNPAWRADMTDGELDVVFHPMSGVLSLLQTLAVHAAGRQSKIESAVYERGRSVRISCARPVHYQLDGDPPQPIFNGSSRGQEVDELSISMSELKLRVLLPAH